MRNHAGFDGQVIRPVYIVEIDFPSGFFRANSSDKHLMVGGNLYYGVGNLGKISETGVSTGTQAQTVKLTLSHVPADQTAGIVAENTRNRPLKISMCLFTEAHALVAPPFVIFNGRIDSLNMEVAQAVTLQVSATSRLINWNRAVNSRYTNEDQQSKYPADKGFKFINQLQTLRIQWGT